MSVPSLQSSQSTRPRQDVPLTSEVCPQGELANEETDLAPCPFCGCVKILASGDKVTGKNGHVWCENDNCDAEIYGDYKQDAIMRWNKRVPRPASSLEPVGNSSSLARLIQENQVLVGDKREAQKEEE